MALTRQLGRRTLVLQPTNSEVSTNQVYTPRYEFHLDGELNIPTPVRADSLKHTDAAFTIYRVDVSVESGGTAAYRIIIRSYDTAGLNAVTHVDYPVQITGDRNRISIPVIDAAVPENRSLECEIVEDGAGTYVKGMTVSLISEDLSELQPERLGHRIVDGDGNVKPQQEDLQFVGATVTDDPGNGRTIVEVGFIGQLIQSMLSEVQMQNLYGNGWILADGRSVAGSVYETITGMSVAPDARGVFLRGKNNGRSDGSEDPAGERALGDYQTDELQAHKHWVFANLESNNPTVVATNQAARGRSAGGEGDWQARGVNNAATVALSSDASNNEGGIGGVGTETRPKNLAVNTFIKIN